MPSTRVREWGVHCRSAPRMAVPIALHSIRSRSGNCDRCLVRPFDPEVMPVDIDMPRVDGYEAIRNRRRTLAEAMRIAFTGWGANQGRQRAREAGFDLHRIRQPGCRQKSGLVTGLPPRTDAA